ncbi:DUF397 domain-containing protein [Streptomyces sp. NPDC095613]|uniref:DUF397 domain-containing protein n=1 Tax=Streptomyces sp. NPDC095613 TaxID=3155540 RepID=UPI00332414D1
MSRYIDLSPDDWVKSSYSSGNGGGCVEWAPSYIVTSGLVPIRDSKTPDGPALTLSPHAWADFVRHAAAARA